MSRERRVRVVPDRRLAGSGGDGGGGGCDGARGAAAGSEVVTARSRAQRAEHGGGERDQAHRERSSSVGLRRSYGAASHGPAAGGSAELRHPRGPEAWPAPSDVQRWSGGGVSREPMERWERRARVGSSTAASRSDGVLRAVAAADGARRL